MDWLRKKAARLGVEFRNASLTKSLFFYMAAGAVAGMMLWILSKNLCESWFRCLPEKKSGRILLFAGRSRTRERQQCVFSGSGIGMGSTLVWRYAARPQEGCFCKKRYILP